MGFEGTNLLGDDYKDYVRDQIIQRQTRLGKNQKTANDIAWINGKTAYFRCASSVDIKNTYRLIKSPGDKNQPDTTAVQDRTGVGKNDIIGVDKGLMQAVLEEIGLPESNETDNTQTILIPNVIGDNPYFAEPVGDARLNQLGLTPDFMGDKLAKFLVLHGGSERALDNNTLQKRHGIISSYTDFSNNLAAYGFKNKDWGFVGMPGIESVDIKSRNMGSLREASISLRVNSADQLKMIDTLYFRLGYSIFLEWGNTSHYNNEGEYKKGADIDYSLLFDFLEPSNEIKKDPIQFLQKIEEARKKSNGNYDAILGKVKNFTWEFNPAGFYTATLSVISWGDIVESLAIDPWRKGVVEQKQLENADSEDNKYEADFQRITKDNESDLNKFIYEASSPNAEIQENGDGTGGTFITRYTPIKNTLISAYSKIRPALGFEFSNQTNQVSTNSEYLEECNYDRSKTNSAGKVVSGWATFGPESTPYYYIRFGDILDFIKERLMLYTGENFNTPLIDINTDPDNNFCFNPGNNVSADPSKVMIRRNPPGLLQYNEGFWTRLWTALGIAGPDKLYNSGAVYNHAIFEGKLSNSAQDLNVSLEPFDTKFNDQLVGNIMNIYLEKEFLYSTLDNLRDPQNGKVFLYKFLKEICTTINSCLGGVNKLDVRIKEDRILEIYDQNPIYGTKLNTYYPGYKYPAELSLYGIPFQDDGKVLADGSLRTLTNRGGSFVTNFGLKTEITNELATTISVGAQANDQVVGEDATIFSKWNFGLVDRIYPEKVDSRKKDSPSDTDYEFEQLTALTRKMLVLWGDYQYQYLTDEVEGFWSRLLTGRLIARNNTYTVYSLPRMNPESFSSYTKLQKDYFSAYFKSQSKIDKQPSNQIGMLPINLNLEMDGISGIRIYDQLHVDTTFLPDYYTDTLTFIIKGVGHKFIGNRWVTTIDTIAQPKVMWRTFNPKLVHTPEDNSETDNTSIDPNPSPEETATQQLPNNLEYSAPLSILSIRGHDDHGDGHYGASRGNRAHKGVDIISNPGDPIFASISGIARLTAPYSNPSPEKVRVNTGVKIIGTGDYEGMTVYYFYTKALNDILGTQVTSGQVIGTALEMATAYGPGMTNHVHFQIGKSSGGNVNSEAWLKENFTVYDNEPFIASNLSSPQVNPSTKAFQSLVQDLQKIYTLTDTFGPNGDPLFQRFKGIINDDEQPAVNALDTWISRPSQQSSVNTLNTNDKVAFEEQFTKLRRKTLGVNTNDNVVFSPPSDPSFSVIINSDF